MKIEIRNMQTNEFLRLGSVDEEIYGISVHDDCSIAEAQRLLETDYKTDSCLWTNVRRNEAAFVVY